MIQRQRMNQQGIGSLLFTMIMIVVISMIVLGFAQLARRNQRQTLDHQLSSQAYYAAESGVNTALHILRSPHFNESTGDNNNCNQFLTNNGANPKLNPSEPTGATYTCVLVDQGALDYLEYKNKVSQNNAVVVPINPVGSLTGITFTWDKPSGSVDPIANCKNDANLPSATSYNCPYGMMRIDIIPVSAGANYNIANLQQSNKTFFVKPTQGSPTSFGLADINSPLQKAGCSDANCQVTITGMGGSYALHISSVYAPLPTLKIAASDSGVKLAGAQVVIDATGRSQDVLRRIKVRAPVKDQDVSVTGAIVSNQAICKRFTVGNGITSNDQCTSVLGP